MKTSVMLVLEDFVVRDGDRGNRTSPLMGFIFSFSPSKKSFFLKTKTCMKTEHSHFPSPYGSIMTIIK